MKLSFTRPVLFCTERLFTVGIIDVFVSLPSVLASLSPEVTSQFTSSTAMEMWLIDRQKIPSSHESNLSFVSLSKVETTILWNWLQDQSCSVYYELLIEELNSILREKDKFVDGRTWVLLTYGT